MRKKSGILISITLFIMLLISGSTVYTVFLIRSITNDSTAINELGIIRGSIQRITKLELSKNSNDQLILKVDKMISDYCMSEKFNSSSNSDVNNSLINLRSSWVDFKDLIYEYRDNPSENNTSLLLNKSEKLWEETNNTVLLAQIFVEGKVGYLRNLLLISFINLVLIIIIYIFIKKYVKNSLEFLVNHDTLTSVYNRKYFNEALKYELKRNNRYEQELSLILFDIDHFKSINDTYGHDIGDEVLKEMTKAINDNIRNHDIFARIGGDEFSIILPHTDINAAYTLSERLRKAIEDHDFKLIDSITLSLGVTNGEKKDTNETIFKRADIALYEAKKSGRNKSICITSNRKESD